jgi:hypothetical protein
MITIQKVTSNFQSVPPASLQTFIDAPNRVQYSTVHIPNAQKFFDHRQVHRDFFITLFTYSCSFSVLNFMLPASRPNFVAIGRTIQKAGLA